MKLYGFGPTRVCRQSISDSWLGNLRECLAHLGPMVMIRHPLPGCDKSRPVPCPWWAGRLRD
jgi:hypothetical protein